MRPSSAPARPAAGSQSGGEYDPVCSILWMPEVAVRQRLECFLRGLASPKRPFHSACILCSILPHAAHGPAPLSPAEIGHRRRPIERADASSGACFFEARKFGS